MRIVILTTETTHHAYFVREVSQFARIDWVLIETEHQVPRFDIAHPYEIDRDRHERATWFGGQSPGVGEFAEAWPVVSVNGAEVTRRLRDTSPDAVFVFGTGRLHVETISACGVNVMNLHGGNPSRYRGLDSHLWAIYHRDFRELVTALHKVTPELDRGDIVEQLPVAISRGMPLAELRRANTETCVRLCQNAIKKLDQKGELRATPQSEAGRYYSHMPAVLKSICVDRFAAHTRNLT